jgi:hypothetical protein
LNLKRPEIEAQTAQGELPTTEVKPKTAEIDFDFPTQEIKGEE